MLSFNSLISSISYLIKLLLNMSQNTIEPTVIDDEILSKTVHDHYEQDMSRREEVPEEILKRERIDPGEVTTLRLDYKSIIPQMVFNLFRLIIDILKIDNLWSYENLTRLQLDNNVIEKIENINFLKNLEWLGTSRKD